MLIYYFIFSTQDLQFKRDILFIKFQFQPKNKNHSICHFADRRFIFINAIYVRRRYSLEKTGHSTPTKQFHLFDLKNVKMSVRLVRACDCSSFIMKTFIDGYFKKSNSCSNLKRKCLYITDFSKNSKKN